MRALHPDRIGPTAIAAWSATLADAVDAGDPEARVPACPDWDLAELAAHVTRVQWFWSDVLRHRPAPPEAVEAPALPVDGSPAELVRWATSELLTALDGVDPAEPAWSWSDHPLDGDVGFTWRRQTHEALIHAVDALQAIGAPIPEIDPLQAADGVDEIVEVMLTGAPPWATVGDVEAVLAIEAVDSGDRWVRGMVTATGRPPGGDADVVLRGFISTGAAPTTIVRGAAADLLLHLWNRAGAERLEIDGDLEPARSLPDLVSGVTG